MRRCMAIRDFINYMNTNPQTGAKFRTKAQLLVDLRTGEVLHNEYDLLCVKPGN
jgi:hypothetical protein